MFAPEGVDTSSFAVLPIAPDGSGAWLTGGDGSLTCFRSREGSRGRCRGIRPDDKLVKWSRNGRELYVASPSGIPQRIFRVDLTTGTRTLWKEVFPTQSAGVRLSEVAVTPDDRAMHSQLLTNLYVVTGVGASR